MQKTVQKILDSFFLLRIPLLAPVWTILILGWITGTSAVHPGGSLLNSQLMYLEAKMWFILLGFSLIVASIYVVNQIVDIESDRINHKLFLLPHNIISVKSAWIMAIACAVAGMLCSVFIDKVIILLFVSSLILGVLYNLPPARLKDRAWGGILANALGHGMLTFLVGWYIAKYGSIDPVSIKTGILSSIAPALANGAVYLSTTIPDSAGDSKTGKKTFCVQYGPKPTAITAAILCTGAFIFSFFMENNWWVMAVPSAISLIFFVYLVVATRSELAFKSFKWPVFLLSAFVAIFVPAYGALILCTFFGSRAYYKWRFGIEYPTFKSQ